MSEANQQERYEVIFFQSWWCHPYGNWSVIGSMMPSQYGIQQVYVANFDWYCYENWFWGLTCFNLLSAYNIWYAICVDVDILPIWMWFVFASFKSIATEMHHVQLPQVDLSNCEIFIGASLQMFDAVFRNSHTTYYTLMLFSEIPILHAHRYNLICTRMHISIAFLNRKKLSLINRSRE